MFTKFGPFEAVIHFAAYKHVGESQSKPLEYYENNLTGSINLLKAMRKHNVKRLSEFFTEFSLILLVFSSSCTVYGDAPCPFDENTPTGHVSLCRAYDFRALSIRTERPSS